MRTEQKPRLKASQRPRYRYILFRADASLDRNAVIRLVQAAAPQDMGAWLTRYEAGRGILRVLRGHEIAARSLLENLPKLGAKTVSTSGTIAALERRHGHS